VSYLPFSISVGIDDYSQRVLDNYENTSTPSDLIQQMTQQFLRVCRRRGDGPQETSQDSPKSRFYSTIFQLEEQ
jgi:hypothetical protein